MPNRSPKNEGSRMVLGSVGWVDHKSSKELCSRAVLSTDAASKILIWRNNSASVRLSTVADMSGPTSSANAEVVLWQIDGINWVGKHSKKQSSSLRDLPPTPSSCHITLVLVTSSWVSELLLKFSSTETWWWVHLVHKRGVLPLLPTAPRRFLGSSCCDDDAIPRPWTATVESSLESEVSIILGIFWKAPINLITGEDK